MNLQEAIKSDNQIIRAIYNELQAQANEIEFHQYDDVNVQCLKDFYMAVEEAVRLLIDNEDGQDI